MKIGTIWDHLRYWKCTEREEKQNIHKILTTAITWQALNVFTHYSYCLTHIQEL